MQHSGDLKKFKEKHPDKFPQESVVFGKIRRGDRIFISTACGEPQYLVKALIDYVENHPQAIIDAEVFHVWTLGVAPYADAKFKKNFRHNSFFIANNTRDAVNQGLADYTPISLSEVPALLNNKLVPVDVALIQTSPPDNNGYMSMGVSVDITKAAVENADLVITQVNRNMPRVHGDTFIHIKDVDHIIEHDEPILTFEAQISDKIAQSIGRYAAKIIDDGDTLQVGYGSIPNAIMSNLMDKRHLGVHTELFSDGLTKLMKEGVIDNSKKTLHRGKAVATFSMGKEETYRFIHDNPSIEFKPIDYTNNPLVISQNRNMTAINSALQVDLTGQASAESIGHTFYSGIGGQADFMRGSVLAPGGKSILLLQSTAHNGEVSRIVPFLDPGAGVTLGRSDVHYIVTEYGIAYLHGKNIRERAMELISIAHPKFKTWLIKEAKKLNIIYKDQAFVPGKKGEYQEELETFRTTDSEEEIFLRPVRICDEPLLKDFFYSLSDQSLYRRFMSVRKDMPHERLQRFCIIDNTREMVILAVQGEEGKERIVGMGEYGIDKTSHTAEVAFAVRDDIQNRGIGKELLDYLILLAKKRGLLGLTAEVLRENQPMLHLFEKQGFEIDRRSSDMESYELHMDFRG